ncbi:hypothetical protein LWI29_033818 [Acer saccharum]|uniref:NERD domain-containing protein n=1 Tax=Acer saccharum TaxID=4024 RepID=A0AA39RZI1_ACESA|nr:hypothetical protein LWI29_033818 [Acer saccharum]
MLKDDLSVSKTARRKGSEKLIDAKKGSHIRLKEREDLSIIQKKKRKTQSRRTELEKLYGGKAYVGLRIPDPDTGSRENIDIVLVTKGEAVVVSVKNFSGFVSVNGDGSWVSESEGRHKVEVHPDPVEEAKKRASILESYLEQRGVALPEGYISYKVMIPNPKFRMPLHLYNDVPWNWGALILICFTLTNECKGGCLSWWQKRDAESINQQLNFILSTAPIWDRLELKGSKFVLGEFIEFKGKQEDTQILRYIKRSKVSHLIIQKTSMFGLAPSRLQVLYSFRDYRSEGASTSEWNEVTVRSSTEVLFQPGNSNKVRKFKLSSILSMSLSA